MHNYEEGNGPSTPYQPDSKNVLASLSPKTSFLVGLVGGIMMLSTIGFAIMLTSYLNGSLVSSGSKVAGATTNSNANVAVANNNAAAGDTAPTHVDIAVADTDHVRGKEDAKVTIVEYSDIQCPYCSTFHTTMKQVMDKYPNDVRWVFRHFPLDSIHPNARPAAIASECVAVQKGNDGFWKFVDAMYGNQSGLSNDFYESTAKTIGIDMTKFKDCVSNKTTSSTVDSMYQGGIKIGVQGTPGSYLNGDALGGAVPFTQLDSQIQTALGK